MLIIYIYFLRHLILSIFWNLQDIHTCNQIQYNESNFFLRNVVLNVYWVCPKLHIVTMSYYSTIRLVTVNWQTFMQNFLLLISAFICNFKNIFKIK